MRHYGYKYKRRKIGGNKDAKIDDHVFYRMVCFICRLEGVQLFLDPAGVVREEGGTEEC